MAVASGREALALVEGGDLFDLAVIDMQMPEMDGLMLARELRQWRSRQALPLVMLSSLGSQPSIEDVILSGSLSKPIKQSSLYNVLVQILSEQAASLEPATQATTFEANLAQDHSLQILVAEDNLVNQKVIAKVLERLGYRADIVANGLEVLEALSKRSYDVVLMDMHMPEMDGLEATRRLVARWGEQERPRVVAMTAAVLEEDRRQCKEAGMDDFASKPVRVEELVEVLKQCHRRAAVLNSP